MTDPVEIHADVRARLRRASLLIADVDVRQQDDGWRALVMLDPLMVSVRAAEQGLSNGSVAAAATDQRVHQALEVVRRRVNASLPPEHEVVAIEIAAHPADEPVAGTAVPPRSQRALVLASLECGR